MSIHIVFRQLINLSIDINRQPGIGGSDSIQLGNVRFWREQDDLMYSHPTSQWNLAVLIDDLTTSLNVMGDSERAARGAGIDVKLMEGGFAWRRSDGGLGSLCDRASDAWEAACKDNDLNVVLCADYMRAGCLAGYSVFWDGHEGGYRAKRHGVSELNWFPSIEETWQAVCRDNDLVPKNPDEYMGALKYQLQLFHPLVPERGAVTPDPYKDLAQSNGFRLRVWNATENGDASDSWFWKKSDSVAGASESAQCFSTEADAWKDCCAHNNLFAPFIEVAASYGYEVRRTDFRSFTWVSFDGLSNRNFFSEGEAWFDCCVVNCLKSPIFAEFAQEDEAVYTMSVTH
jgi:hypothetical protein